MKSLALTQPWASLVVLGKKKIETRGWGTGYRGELAIQSTKVFGPRERALLEKEPFKSALGGCALPLGAVLGTVLVTGSLVMTETKNPDPLLRCLDIATVAEPERSFGGYERGRHAIFLAEPKLLPVPVPSRGFLGIFDLAEEVAERVCAQLEALEERAGILQFDAGLSRDEAEKKAFQEATQGGGGK